MLNETLKNIETRIRGGKSISEDNRGELLRLVETLRGEIEDLSRTRAEHAASITGFTDASTREAMREEQDPKLLELALEGLSSSVREFETSHPSLSKSVNSICTMLSNLGI